MKVNKLFINTPIRGPHVYIYFCDKDGNTQNVRSYSLSVVVD